MTILKIYSYISHPSSYLFWLVVLFTTNDECGGIPQRKKIEGEERILEAIVLVQMNTKTNDLLVLDDSFFFTDKYCVYVTNYQIIVSI